MYVYSLYDTFGRKNVYKYTEYDYKAYSGGLMIIFRQSKYI